MIINGKKYRIKEEVYKNGDKNYTAQYAINCLFFNIWKDYPSEIADYGYATVRFICTGNTYEECKERLLKSIETKEKLQDSKTVVNIKYFN